MGLGVLLGLTAAFAGFTREPLELYLCAFVMMACL
jgi:hypothetical protein